MSVLTIGNFQQASVFPVIAWDMVLVIADVFHLLSGISVSFKVAGVV